MQNMCPEVRTLFKQVEQNAETDAGMPGFFMYGWAKFQCATKAENLVAKLNDTCRHAYIHFRFATFIRCTWTMLTSWKSQQNLLDVLKSAEINFVIFLPAIWPWYYYCQLNYLNRDDRIHIVFVQGMTETFQLASSMTLYCLMGIYVWYRCMTEDSNAALEV